MLKSMFLAWRVAGIAAAMAFLMTLGLGVAPIASGAGTQKILIVGDSLTHGSTNDYSWRYWLWRNFAPGTVDFVGPRSDLNNLVSQDRDDTSDHTYTRIQRAAQRMRSSDHAKRVRGVNEILAMQGKKARAR